MTLLSGYSAPIYKASVSIQQAHNGYIVNRSYTRSGIFTSDIMVCETFSEAVKLAKAAMESK